MNYLKEIDLIYLKFDIIQALHIPISILKFVSFSFIEQYINNVKHRNLAYLLLFRLHFE